MLNISKYNVNKFINLESYKSFQRVYHVRHHKYLSRFLGIFTLIGIIILFLPWTQTVSGNGFVTTLTPDQRPQSIQSPIPGRIEKWYVKEGDHVKKGDTILFISEIKNEYQDPLLLERTLAQRDAKSKSADSYKSKVGALEGQLVALQQERSLKLNQANNYLIQAQLQVKSDSTDLEAAKINFNVAELQLNRFQSLFEEGLKSKTDLEQKRLKYQETQAKLISAENNWLGSKNKVINAQLEIGRISAEYADKIAKAQSDKYTAASSQFEAEVQVSKLDNQSANYEIRNRLYYITAPQNGYINKALRSGLGETIKEGEELVGIMPSEYDLAVESYIDPLDLPLVHLDEKVRIQFEGWPVIFFTGWPNASYGTFGGRVVAIETFISDNGKFRVLIAPDAQEQDWPKNVRVGSGAYTIALLDDVPMWYEIWRRLNGFPPNYYNPNSAENTKNNKK